ncbi:hypothetical protein AB0C33_02050 [Nonomuraea sp. NPDC048881]|uniref:hypothetical protein n=1 Tax=Nonomuraea sp. NPDC048881 TaxID=3155030 RepID=UPI0033DF7D0E
MRRLDSESLKFWEETSHRYHEQLTETALSYLAGRGLSMAAVDYYRIGYVDDPAAGHDDYRGRIALPILKKCGAVGFQFRCIEDHRCKDAKHAKYYTDGDQWLYNTAALDEPGDVIGFCEGAFNAYILSFECGIPTLGIPGADSWKGHPWWADIAKGHRKRLFFADNDASNDKNPGVRLGKEAAKDVLGLKLILMPEDEDPNSTFLKFGREEIYRRAGYVPPSRRHLELVS